MHFLCIFIILQIVPILHKLPTWHM